VEPLMRCYALVCCKHVFSCFLKLSLPTAGSLRYSGNEFQTVWPATEKARPAKELSR